MHGVTKEVLLKVEFTGKGKGAGPQETMSSGRDAATTVSGWGATTTLKRSDFGLTWNQSSLARFCPAAAMEGIQIAAEIPPQAGRLEMIFS